MSSTPDDAVLADPATGGAQPGADGAAESSTQSSQVNGDVDDGAAEEQREEEVEPLDGDLTDILFGIFDDVLNPEDEDETMFDPLDAEAKAEEARKAAEAAAAEAARKAAEEAAAAEAAAKAEEERLAAEAAASKGKKGKKGKPKKGKKAKGKAKEVVKPEPEPEPEEAQADDDETKQGDPGQGDDAAAVPETPKRVYSAEELEDLQWQREQYRQIDSTRDEEIHRYRKLEKYLRQQRAKADAHDAAQAAKPSYDSTNDDASMFWKKPETRSDEAFGGKGDEVVDETAQKEVASFLEKWQKDVRNNVPLGPSRLVLEKEFLRECGELGGSLLVVRDVMEENERLLLAKSGNVPLSGAYDLIRQSEVAPKYLNATKSVEHRKHLVLEHTAQLQKRRGLNNTQDLDEKSGLGEDDVDIISLEATIPDRKASKNNKTKKQKKTLAAAQRDENDLILRRLKVAAEPGLPHPRFRDQKGQGSLDFDFPEEVLFSKYTAGGTFKRIVKFRNKGAVSRKLRILPPTTQYFSTSQLRFPKSKEGEEKGIHIIAPGMACDVTITFAPDTEGIYRDVVKCVSETLDFEVPLRAHRDPPKLTIPKLLSCGHCLVAGVKPCTFQFVNKGGPGKFRLLPLTAWPLDLESEPRFLWNEMPGDMSSISDGKLSVAPFEVSPAEFELNAGDATKFEVTFRPFVAGEEKLQLAIVCDNCDVQIVTLDGFGSYLSVRTIAIGGLNCLLPADAVDGIPQPKAAWGTGSEVNDAANADAIVTTLRDSRPIGFPAQIVLPPTLRGVRTQRTITLENPIPLEVPFHWEITPSPPPKDPERPTTDTLAQLRISPAKGVFGPNSKIVFTVQATPKLRQNVMEHVTLMVDGVPRGCERPQFVLPFPSEDSPKLGGSSNQDDESQSLVTLPYHSFGVFGQVVPRDVVIPCPRIALSDPVIVGVPIVRHFDIVNRSGVPTNFSIDLEDAVDDSSLKIELSPSEGTLLTGEGGKLSVQVTITATKLGKFAGTLRCIADDVAGPLGVRVSGQAIGPEISILTPQVDFGIVRAGDSVTRKLPFTNLSPVPAPWSVSLAGAAGETSKFTFAPSSGILAPGKKVNVVVTCEAGTEPEIIRNAVRVQIEGSEPRFVQQRADIQQLKCYIDRSALKLGNSYVGVPITQTVVLRNATELPAQFRWRVLNPPGKESCTLKFSQRQGTVDRRGAQEIDVTFTPLSAVRFELLCICEVVGMPEPIGFVLTSLARGLILSFVSTTEDEAQQVTKLHDAGQEPDIKQLPVNEKPVHLDFGDDVPIFTKRTQWFSVRNHSGVDTSFTLVARKYPPAPMDPLDFSSTAKSKTSQLDATATMGGTINPGSTTASFKTQLKPLEASTTGKSRTLRRKLLGQEHERTERFVSEKGRHLIAQNQEFEDGRGLLRAGNGIAFLVPQEEIALPAWSTRLVPVRCFGDIPGSYRDEIIATIAESSGLAPVRVAVKAKLTGCPIALQESSVGLDCSLTPSLLNFGAVPHSSAARRRVISVRNNAPLTAKLSWRCTANLDKEPDLFEIKFNFLDGADSTGDEASDDPKLLEVAFKEKTYPPLPFRVTPLSVDIKPRSIAKFEVEYDPPTAAQLSKALLVSKVDWKMKQKSPSRMSSLAQKIKMAQSAVRKFYPAVAPASGSHVPESDDKVLVLALQAETVVPKLTVMKRGGALRDPDPKSGGKAPTLKLQMASTATPRMVSSDIAVANDSLTDVVFHIVTDAPFSLLPKPSATAFKHPLASSSPSTTASASRKGGKAKPGNATNWYKLDPRGNLELTVFYKWSGPTAAQLQLNGAAAELPPMEEESGSMWIKYVNGETQEIKLRGVVKRPVVEVGLNRGVVPPAFNFGLLHAGVDMDGDGVADTMVCDSDANVTVLYLGNRTHVPATWSVSHVKSTATSEFVDDPSVFALAQTEGVRQGPTVPVDSGLIWNRLPEGVHNEQKSSMPTPIRIHFRPKSDVQYRSTFCVHVDGGIGTTFTLEGQGTFEELDDKL